MGNLFKVYNGAAPTTAAIAPVTTGTAIKTLLQIASPTAVGMTVVSWGIDFDGTAAATPIRCELVETDVAATVTAHAAGNVIKMNRASGDASQIQYGTALSGYTATAEGTITATRLLDYHLVAPTNQFAWEWSLGRESWFQAAKFLRVRVTATAAVNAVCWVMWEE